MDVMNIISGRRAALIAINCLFALLIADWAGVAFASIHVQLSDDVPTQLSIPFVENCGQLSDPSIKYVATLAGGSCYVTQDGRIVYSMAKAISSGSRDSSGIDSEPHTNARTAPEMEAAPSIDVITYTIEESLPGTTNVKIFGLESNETVVNYILGNDPLDWKTSLSTYDVISLGEIKPGVELKLKSYQQKVEKFFHVKPGARPQDIIMNINRAESLSINGNGELEIKAGKGTLRFSRPVAFQEVDGQKREVQVSYVVVNKQLTTDKKQLAYGFEVGEYDRSKELVIDPVVYSTNLNISACLQILAMTKGTDGNLYVTGRTTNDLAYNRNAFVGTISANSGKILVLSYFGGISSINEGRAVAIDSTGAVVVAGDTNSARFPVTTGCYNTTYRASSRTGFVIKFRNKYLTSIGAGTYLGGSNYETLHCLAVDGGNNIYIAGAGNSTNFPVTTGAYKTAASWQQSPARINNYSVFVSKFNSGLTQLTYSTYIGGGVPFAMALDSSNNIVLAGSTHYTSFPTTSYAYQKTKSLDDSAPVGFICKLYSGFNQLLASTFFADLATIYDMKLDQKGNVYVAGEYYNANYLYSWVKFPATTGAYKSTYGGGYDAFVAMLDSNLSKLQAATLYGGTWDESAYALQVTNTGRVIIAGDQLTNSQRDIFIAEFNQYLTNLVTTNRISATGNNYLFAMVQGEKDQMILAGNTYSLLFPITISPSQSFSRGLPAGFIAVVGKKNIMPIINFILAN